MAVRVYLERAGCDRRLLDAQRIKDYLSANGYELVDDPTQADRILAITCAFKQQEEDESVRRLRTLRKYKRDIVVYGCLPDISSERYEEFDDLPYVAPRDIGLISRHFEPSGVPFDETPDANTIERTRPSLPRAKRLIEAGLLSWEKAVDWLQNRASSVLPSPKRRAEAEFNLFVCRGCRGSCSYCAIRKAIAGVKSKAAEEIVAEFRAGVAAGHRRFNILGDDPGCWGLDISSKLPQLMGRLFDEGAELVPEALTHSNGVRPLGFRIREIHPKYLVRYVDDLVELPGIGMVEHVLCPVQSGSDRILELMDREHSSTQLLSAVRQLRERVPDVSLETQIIVGFPSETEDDLERTVRHVAEAGFDSVVVFPYDDKHGTVASTLDGKIPDAEIMRRVRRTAKRLRQSGIGAYRSCP